jgi:hypothetical protein
VIAEELAFAASELERRYVCVFGCSLYCSLIIFYSFVSCLLCSRGHRVLVLRFVAREGAPLEMFFDLDGNIVAEGGEADVMPEVVVVGDSSSEDEKKDMATGVPPAAENVRKTNGASRKRGSSAVLDNGNSLDEEKASKGEVLARNLRTRTSKVSYAEKDHDDDGVTRRRTPSKKKAAKEKVTEDKGDDMKEGVPQNGSEGSQKSAKKAAKDKLEDNSEGLETGDAVAADASGTRPSRKTPKRSDAADKEEKRLALEAAVRAKEVRLTVDMQTTLCLYPDYLPR